MKYKKRKFWTDEELSSLKEDYCTLTVKELELKYDRNMCSIQDKANTLKYSRNYDLFWKDSDIESLKLDYPVLPKAELESKYKKSMNSIVGKAMRLGIHRSNQLFRVNKPLKSLYSKEEIKNLYCKGMSLKEISEISNVGKSRISAILRETNTELRETSKEYRKYHVEDNFFDLIDTEEKAYILGFLYADGYNNSNDSSISIRLSIKDKKLLDDIASILTSRIVKTYKVKEKEYCQLSISSKIMSKSLHNLGCIQAKSLILQFPTEDQVPKELQRHFIRGYFDGDGCITKSKKNHYSISVTSTYMFNEKLRQVLNENCSVINERKLRFYKNNITCDLRYSRKSQLLDIKEYLYKDATIYLERKFDKFNLIN